MYSGPLILLLFHEHSCYGFKIDITCRASIVNAPAGGAPPKRANK